MIICHKYSLFCEDFQTESLGNVAPEITSPLFIWPQVQWLARYKWIFCDGYLSDGSVLFELSFMPVLRFC